MISPDVDVIRLPVLGDRLAQTSDQTEDWNETARNYESQRKRPVGGSWSDWRDRLTLQPVEAAVRDLALQAMYRSNLGLIALQSPAGNERRLSVKLHHVSSPFVHAIISEHSVAQRCAAAN